MRWFCAHISEQQHKDKGANSFIDSDIAANLNCSSPHMCSQNQPWLGYDCYKHKDYPCCRIPPAFPKLSPINCTRACPNPPPWPQSCFLANKRPSVKCLSADHHGAAGPRNPLSADDQTLVSMTAVEIAARIRRIFAKLDIQELFV